MALEQRCDHGFLRSVVPCPTCDPSQAKEPAAWSNERRASYKAATRERAQNATGARHPGAAVDLVLGALREQPWQTHAELSKLLGYNAGQTLDRLIEKGQLQRRKSDRRYAPYEYALLDPTPAVSQDQTR